MYLRVHIFFYHFFLRKWLKFANIFYFMKNENIYLQINLSEKRENILVS